MCFGCSKEPPFEDPQHMFWMRNKENSFPIHTLIRRPTVTLKNRARSPKTLMKSSSIPNFISMQRFQSDANMCRLLLTFANRLNPDLRPYKTYCLIWIQTNSQSDVIPEWFFENVTKSMLRVITKNLHHKKLASSDIILRVYSLLMVFNVWKTKKRLGFELPHEKSNIFLFLKKRSYSYSAQKHCLIQMDLLNTHNICFGREIRKLFFFYALLTKGL